VGFDLKDMSHDDPLQSSWNVFYKFHALHLESRGGQDLGCLLDGHGEWEELTEPAS
jgi:hypothetical protein